MIEKDGDGDTIMQDGSSSLNLPVSPTVPEAAGSSTVAIAVGMLKDMMKRNTVRRARGFAHGAEDRGRRNAVSVLGRSQSCERGVWEGLGP